MSLLTQVYLMTVCKPEIVLNFYVVQSKVVDFLKQLFVSLIIDAVEKS